MRSGWHTIGLIAFLTILLTQFTNCDVYSDNSVFNTFSSICKGEDCVQKNKEFLELKINSEGDILVYNGVSTISVGGECNEGGYGANIITWNLYDDAGFVSNSDAAGTNSSCIMGRFNLKVKHPRGMFVNGSNVPVPHVLEVEIRGIDGSGAEQTNTLAKRKVFIRPI